MQYEKEQVSNRFRYTDQQYDGVTGQYYLRARYYNPVIGRFTQEDSYYVDGLNLYAYCANHPVGYSDPSGYSCNQDVHDASNGNKGTGDTDAAKPYDAATGTDPVLALPEPGESSAPVSAKRAAAEKKLADAAAGVNVGKTIDPLTGHEVGTIYVDGSGNAMISPVGGGINPNGVGFRGGDIETVYPNGSSYQRNNPNGHAKTSGQNHGHGHLMGTGPGPRGSGPSIDTSGNVVDFWSPDAHWPTKR